MTTLQLLELYIFLLNNFYLILARFLKRDAVLQNRFRFVLQSQQTY